MSRAVNLSSLRRVHNSAASAGGGAGFKEEYIW